MQWGTSSIKFNGRSSQGSFLTVLIHSIRCPGVFLLPLTLVHKIIWLFRTERSSSPEIFRLFGSRRHCFKPNLIYDPNIKQIELAAPGESELGQSLDFPLRGHTLHHCDIGFPRFEKSLMWPRAFHLLTRGGKGISSLMWHTLAELMGIQVSTLGLSSFPNQWHNSPWSPESHVLPNLSPHWELVPLLFTSEQSPKESVLPSKCPFSVLTITPSPAGKHPGHPPTSAPPCSHLPALPLLDPVSLTYLIARITWELVKNIDSWGQH